MGFKIQAYITSLTMVLIASSTFMKFCQAFRHRSPFTRLVIKGSPSSHYGREPILQTFIPHRSHFHSTVSCRLNRFLFDPCEVDLTDSISSSNGSPPTVTLAKDDYRTIHAAKILNLQNGDAVRAGIVGFSSEQFDNNGTLTDQAIVEWMPEGKVKKAEPLKNGNPPGSIRFRLDSLVSSPPEQSEMRVSLILALPRPIALGRMLPQIAQLGVDNLVLVGAQKVPKDYFGSHLLRQPEVLRERLIEGLCQAGDVRLPRIHLKKNLRDFLSRDLDSMFPSSDYARVIAHPQRATDKGSPPLRIRDVKFPSSITDEDGTSSPLPRRMVVAVGPEGGWVEPDELERFAGHEFQQVTLGTRTLRSDVAVVSLLSLAHDACTTDSDTSL